MPVTQRQTIDQIPVPPPVGGINAVSPATAMPDTDALSLVNMIGGQTGVMSRFGYDVHATGLGGEVRTVIPFAGGTSGLDRLFATTPNGLYDTTTAAITLKQAFSITGSEAGWGSFTSFVTNGGHFAFYADEANGLFRYSGTTDAWTAVTDITGTDFDATKIAGVMVWKNRLWLVERDSGNAWFLPVGAIAGAAARQPFGNKFQRGGYLVGLWNWTRDGGSGMDDFLVAISSGGDALVYKGTDPVTSFEQVGTYYLGALPAGRRIATDHGGDLLVLCQLGVMPMSRLVNGAQADQVQSEQYTTTKIQPLFHQYMTERSGYPGWSVRLHPQNNALVINMPLFGQRYEQLAMSLATQGWSVLSGVPSVSSEVWRSKFYFGTPDGRVCVAVDGDDNGVPVEWWGQTAFAPSDGKRKRVQMIQLLMRTSDATSAPGVTVQARYDLRTDAILVAPPPPGALGTAAFWDAAYWDAAYWPGGEAVVAPWRGASGSGHYASIAFRGQSNARTTLMGFNVRFDSGGIL